jgi:peptidoglycan/xylan/chitin deacetylase (PgdA/CDA1 family)
VVPLTHPPAGARIVVFTGDLSYSVRKGILDIDASMPGLCWLIILCVPRKRLAGLLRSQWRNLRRNGWRWIPYQALDVLDRLRALASAPPLPADGPGMNLSASALADRRNIKLLRVPSLVSRDTLEAVRTFAPDLGVSLAAPVLRRALFSIPRLGTLNLHKGKLPQYRGMPPAFWELWNGENSVGCSIHFVDDTLDTGAVVKQADVAREKYSTVRGMQLTLDEVGIKVTRDAVTEVLHGTATTQPQQGLGKTYRKPTLAQQSMLTRRLSQAHALPATSLPRRAVKRSRSALARGLWHAGAGRLLAPRITVLLYHRVSDEVRDNLTVGIEQFERQMALLRRHCAPLSIQQVIETQRIERSPKPLVAVTFDDGYLDNYKNAAPILMRHSVPAAFFVSTGIVGNQGRFPHDLKRGNAPIPVMSWDQLREMHASGFTIGSHSVTHIDCAAEREDRVIAELGESRDTLARELGVVEPIFAYPYGGRQNMTPERLALVKQSNYVACLSAYGGSNVGDVDRFDVRRRGIHWGFSDSAFLFECLGLS